jgi:3-oxoadipate enol-lactonase
MHLAIHVSHNGPDHLAAGGAMPIAELSGTEIHYRDAGSSRETVVLLHAFPLCSGMWSRQIEFMKKRYRIIAPDFPGLGRSAPGPAVTSMEILAEIVTGLLEQLSISRAVLAGLSMGGYLCFELYRRAPGIFRGLVLCDTRPGEDTPEGAQNRERFAESAIAKGLGWVADEMTPKLLRPHPEPAVVRELRRLVAEGTPAGVAAAQRGMARRPDSTATLSQIACPTLVVVGEEDSLTPPEVAEKMAAAVPRSRLVKIPDAGHISNMENPQAFQEAFSSWLAELPA